MICLLYHKFVSCPHYLDDTIDFSLKKRLASRTSELFSEYRQHYKKESGYTASGLMATLVKSKNNVVLILLKPYFYMEAYLSELSDRYQSKKLLEEEKKDLPKKYDAPINWEKDQADVLALAKTESSNNEFGIENGYYTTYIGKKLPQFQDKDKELSYSDSEEYDDLRLLLDACRIKKIKPLVISPPLHGSWSDYTGFTKEKREAYYSKVSGIVKSYGFPLADFKEKEYTPYFLSDIMHLGWEGWREADYAIYQYYHENQ